MRKLLILSFLVCSIGSYAQFNEAGRFHASIGGAVGFHATKYYQKFTFNFFGTPVSVDTTTTDGAATYTLPIELDFGLAKFMSLGLYLEPGAYLDSSATESNNLMMAGIQPRFYLLNKDRFALLASLQLGVSALNIVRDEAGTINDSDSRYLGFQWGLGTGMAVGFGNHLGMRFMLRYVSTSMPLRAAEQNGSSIDLDNFEAKLTTGGVLLQLSFCVRFGGN
ncbi:MAG: hypothetical protein IPK70_04850 [Flavobacteriales bacterium]|jgi:hypothetical protein|nr:hypothetical protein [Flavobacteriales bacterium]